MKRILIFSGTTEGRTLSEILSDNHIYHDVCVATEYGEQVMTPSEYTNVLTGRLNADEIKSLVINGDYLCVVDATHPFATIVTKNIKEAVGDTVPYYRLGRKNGEALHDNCEVKLFNSTEECIEALKIEDGNVLLTTGSKDLPLYTEDCGLKERIVARVIPGKESLDICYGCGLEGKQIIAMQGPFSKEMNLALIKQYGISILVTKESGQTGGVDEKLLACKEANVKCFMIRKPDNEVCITEINLEELIANISKLAGVDISFSQCIEITLAGFGMGSDAYMTLALKQTLRETDYLFGAKRLIEGVNIKGQKYPYYLAKDILPKIKEQAETGKACKITVLFSGDTGFYSGAKKLCKELETIPNLKINVIPGISTMSAFCALTKESYDDAIIISTHGVKESVWKAAISDGLMSARKMFFLTSGCDDVREIGKLVESIAVDNYEILLCYQISYPDEKVMKVSAKECKKISEEGLYAGMLKPVSASLKKTITYGLSDDEFVRGNVPMTKEEVREVSISKLRINADSVVYDIGSGTGSVACEIARLSPTIRVCAIETNQEGIELISKNAEKFSLHNIDVIKSLAPNGLSDLPKASHAFIGGTKGNLKEILEALESINPKMRVVMNAVSLESIAEMQKLIGEFKVKDLDIATVSVSKAREVGSYHLMQANNPVTVFSFSFDE